MEPRSRGVSSKLARALLLLAQALGGITIAEAQDGALDPSFEGGKLLISWGANAGATAVTPVAGGRLLVGGRIEAVGGSWAISEVTESGQLGAPWAQDFEPVDFSGEGSGWSASTIYAMRRDASGRTLVVGEVATPVISHRPAMVRLLADGQPDPAFGGNGIVVLGSLPAGWSFAQSATGLPLASGKFVFVGVWFDSEVGFGAFVLRLTAAGQPDPSFSDDGWLTFDLNGYDFVSPGAVAVDGAGRLLVAGSAASGSEEKIFVARVTLAGSLDPAYGGGDGISELLDAADAAATSIALDPVTGRAYVGIGAPNIFTISAGGVAAFTAGGLVDTSFSGTGLHGLDLEEGSRIDSLALQSDGKLLAAGTIDANGAPPGDFLLARLTPAGVRDSTFDGNGIKRVSFDQVPDAEDRARATAIWGGRMVVVGRAEEGDLNQEAAFALVRTTSALVFTDGFERGSAASWDEN